MSKPTLLVSGSLRLGIKKTPSAEIPVQYITTWLKKRMPEYGGHSSQLADRILIVRAETGSGKSTTLPVAIFRILRDESTPAKLQYKGPGVICTQPRVLTTISLANDVSSRAWNPDMILGTTVGYQTGPVSNKPPSGLLYATAGVLAVQLRNQSDSEIMGRYRFILIDEAHERALDSDMLLMLLRNFYQRNIGNNKLPFLLLTSATFDTQRYAEYFGVTSDNIVEVVGRAYPITIHWPEQGTNNYPAEAAAVAVRIHESHLDDKPEKADILIFMPGNTEMATAATALNKASKASSTPFLVLSLNREIVISQTGDYPLVFAKIDQLPLLGGKPPARRIIVSTVVAETGLTIDTLRYVIDCGWSRSKEMYQPWGAEGLITRPAPQSRIEQRKGRAGRLFPGDFYPLYTKNVFTALEPQQLPEIISVGSSMIHLAIISEQQKQKLRTGKVPEFFVEDMTLLDPPPVEAFLAANATAFALGFVSTRAPLPTKWPPVELTAAVTAAPIEDPRAVVRGYGLTALGHFGAVFSRTSMEGVRVLLAGYQWNCAASDLITAVAMFGNLPTDLLVSRGRSKSLLPDALPPGSAILRAALPSYIVNRFGGGDMVMPPTESEAFYFRSRLLIADDFIESILIFDAFITRLDTTEGDVAAQYDWCVDMGLNFTTMLDVIRKREIIVQELLMAGLNPFRASKRRIAALPMDEFIGGLRALKHCLYDGLQGKLLKWDPKIAAYVSPQGLAVQGPELFSDKLMTRLKAFNIVPGPTDPLRPQWIVTDQIRLAPAPKRSDDSGPPLLYLPSTGLVSVLDGFIDPDPDFNAVRHE
jgi:hypothetical protein